MTETSQAVFLSYASQDAEAARRIAEALRAARVEVWFDQIELRGGDAWDRQIRKQIHDCALFIPVVSAHSQERLEGYFRREWKLAVDRTHDMAEEKAFLLPVVIDGTSERDASVPDRFRDVQWSRLPAGETPPAFVQRVQGLLSPETPASTRAATATAGVVRTPGQAPMSAGRKALVAAAVVLVSTVAYLAIDKPWAAKVATFSATVAPSGVPAAFNPPPHSIAVLPFVNMSGDKEQEYFSDGLTEELLNALSRNHALQVAGRTSSFYFKGQHADLPAIAHKLNVADLLEGSVRRSEDTLRITAQLTDAVTGFQLWSQTYDRTLSNALKLQSDIANEVASALQVAMLRDSTLRVDIGGTSNPAAFDAYLHALKAFNESNDEKTEQAAIANYSDAIRLDPHYALAYAGRAIAYIVYAWDSAQGQAVEDNLRRGERDAHEAITLAPDLAESHLALSYFLEFYPTDFERAMEEYERTLALGRGNAWVLRKYGLFAVMMGRTDVGLSTSRQAVALDPLNYLTHHELGMSNYFARRYSDALAAYEVAQRLEPGSREVHAWMGLVYYALGDLQHARSSCEADPDYWNSLECLALTYARLGRPADAQAALAKLHGEDAAYEISEVYAQWGNIGAAITWLQTAMRRHESSFEALKVDPLMDPLRKEPRFQAIERALRFPD